MKECLRVMCLKAEYRIKRRLWLWWHGRLPFVFSERMYHYPESRPKWHICCNGDAGGWRLTVCDWLEYRWRDLEHVLFQDYGLSWHRDPNRTPRLHNLTERLGLPIMLQWGFWWGLPRRGERVEKGECDVED